MTSKLEKTSPDYSRLMLCVNLRAGDILPSCGAVGAREIAEQLALGIKKLDIPLELETLHCMGKCHLGPTMRLAPGGPFIMGIKLEDVPHVLDMLKSRKFEQLAKEFPLAELSEYD